MIAAVVIGVYTMIAIDVGIVEALKVLAFSLASTAFIITAIVLITS